MSPARVRLNRELGQHFLVDENILGVIGRLAELSPDDDVLEIGAGLGVLTRYLASHVRTVHAVEIDHLLEEQLRETLQGLANVQLLFGDAMALDLAGLDPAPTKLVANLPYGIATPVCVESLDGLPSGHPLVCDAPAGGRRSLRCGAGDDGRTARCRCSCS